MVKAKRMTTTNPVNNNNNNIEWYTYYKNQETNTCSTCSPGPGLTAMLVCLLYVALRIPHTQIVTAKLVILVTISLTIVYLNDYAIWFEWCAQKGSDLNTSSIPHEYLGYE